MLRTTGTPAPHIAVEQIRRLTAEGVVVTDARAAKSQRHAFAEACEYPARRRGGRVQLTGSAGDGRHSSSAHVAIPTSATTAPSAHTPGQPTVA